MKAAKYSVEHGLRGALQLGKGLCPHCNHRVAFLPPQGGTPSWSYVERVDDEESPNRGTLIEHTFIIGLCPDLECGRPTILYEVAESVEGVWDSRDVIKHQVVYPAESGRILVDEEVPLDLRELYAEAGRIEALSPNGAAFLGRRILERVLREQLKSSSGTPLAKLIDEYIRTSSLPAELDQLMHDVRSFGNIAAHPLESIDNQILDVEPQEATYVLDVIAELLNFIYVRPTKQRRMRERYEAKNAGRVPESSSEPRGISVVESASKKNPPAPTPFDSDDLPF